MHDLPGSLRLTSTFPFVGRSAELETLRTLMPRARGRGPPRRAASAASPGRARAGSCASSPPRRRATARSSSTAPATRSCARPYGPFVEALDHLARVTDPAELRAALGTAGGELTRLLPDLPARVGDLPPPVEADPDTERHRLHTAVTDLLTGVSRGGRCCSCSRTGTGPTPRRCCSCATSRAPPGSARVLLLATFRDTEADVPRDALRDARRPAPVRRRRPAAARRALAARRWRSSCGAPRAATLGAGLPELARAISDLTEGNAVPRLRALARARRDRAWSRSPTARSGSPARSAELGTPESVREVVSQRLARLAPGTTELLELAATAGSGVRARRRPPRRRPRRARAARRARRGGPQRHDRGAPLPPAGLPLHPRARAAGALRPAHGAAAGGAPPARRRGARERRRAFRPRARRPRAPLRRRGAVRRRRTRGVEYNVRAARAADGRARLRRGGRRGCAPRSSCGSRARAERAEVLPRARHRQPPRRARRSTRWRRSGRRRTSPASCGDAELLARAAIGYEDACWRPGIADQGAVELLEEAAAALGDESSDAARRPARRARPRARLPGRPRARRDRPHERRRHGPAARAIAPASPPC